MIDKDKKTLFSLFMFCGPDVFLAMLYSYTIWAKGSLDKCRAWMPSQTRSLIERECMVTNGALDRLFERLDDSHDRYSASRSHEWYLQIASTATKIAGIHKPFNELFDEYGIFDCLSELARLMKPPNVFMDCRTALPIRDLRGKRIHMGTARSYVLYLLRALQNCSVLNVSNTEPKEITHDCNQH